MSVALRRLDGDLQLAIFATGRLSYGRGEYFALGEDSDPLGLIRRCESLAKAIPKLLAETEAALSAARADLPRLERQLTGSSFAKQDRLELAKARLHQLEAELQPPKQEARGHMKAADLNEEWQRLDPETQTAVGTVVDAARRTGGRSGEPWREGEVYAYPHAGGGIAWGVDGAAGNLYRGVMPAPANGLGPGDYLQGLKRAGSDEEAFHAVFVKLSADPKLDDKALTSLAGAYCGTTESWPERSAALGAIETAFYEKRKRIEAQVKHR